MSNTVDYSKRIYNIKFKECFESLKELGLVKNMSELADIIGTYNHIVSDIIKGKRKPTKVMLYVMVKRFGLDANFFFGKSNQMFIESEKAKIAKAFIGHLANLENGN